MPIFLLIRHGENDYIRTGRLPGRLPGIHLNEEGCRQAKNVADRLAGVPVKAVFSSPLERTMETAELIARILQLEVKSRDGLIEVDCGEWQGQKISRLRQLRLWKDLQHSPTRFLFPGGESLSEAQHRICQELESLAGEHESNDILICVAHADPIKLAVAYFIGMPMDMFQRLYIAPASITALAIHQTESRLLVLNYEFSFSLSMA